MSLNGLDDPKVVEAFEAANAEPGGWYVTQSLRGPLLLVSLVVRWADIVGLQVSPKIREP